MRHLRTIAIVLTFADRKRFTTFDVILFFAVNVRASLIATLYIPRIIEHFRICAEVIATPCTRQTAIIRDFTL